jgi:hypothetical protein
MLEIIANLLRLSRPCTISQLANAAKYCFNAEHRAFTLGYRGRRSLDPACRCTPEVL